jgi:membrane-bound metal-dependent hydrolase YbcI (DUF457 family)
MDTITHGIAGALIGKAVFGGDDLFAQRPASRERVLTWAAMLGAILPDSDVFRGLFSHNPLLIITWHRSITHSLICLPAFALGLAAATRWFVRKRGWDCPSFAMLTLVYAVGILSHILFDMLNSFGTMIWSPLAWTRPAWDLVFIVDFTFSAILLLPQFLASLYEAREGFLRHSLRSWAVCVLAALFIAGLSKSFGVEISMATVSAVIVLLAALFFAPRLGGWGFSLRRAAWCRIGLTFFAAYIGVAIAAHRAALERVRQFAAQQHLEVLAFAALPLPPSIWHWDGLIHTPRGIYEMRLDVSVRDPGAQQVLEYDYYPEALGNLQIFEVRDLPSVRKVLAFTRFPVTRFRKEGDVAVVEIADVRFRSLIAGRTWPFTYRVRLDQAGHVLSEGWVRR